MPDIRNLWREQKTEESVTLDDIRRRATKFQKRIRDRNLVEYIAAAFVVVLFGLYVWLLAGMLVKIGSALCIVGSLFVVWQLHRRASAEPVPDAALLDFHRRALVRQRDALRSVWLWYLAPFVPGVALMILGRWFQSHASWRTLARDHEVILMAAAVVFLIFLAVWLLNVAAAAKLDRRIDDLDRMRGD
jgi:hypothetical protein